MIMNRRLPSPATFTPEEKAAIIRWIGDKWTPEAVLMFYRRGTSHGPIENRINRLLDWESSEFPELRSHDQS
jgi:hypothetical protein